MKPWSGRNEVIAIALLEYLVPALDIEFGHLLRVSPADLVHDRFRQLVVFTLDVSDVVAARIPLGCG